MTYVKGLNSVVTISGFNHINPNALEVILRDSGRFVLKYPNQYIALSEKKNRSITISGSIAISDPAQYLVDYEANPTAVQFSVADNFPQDLLNEYDVEEQEVYGIVTVGNLTVNTKPTDAEVRLLGTRIQEWISRQPLTSWNNEDSVIISLLAYNHLPTKAFEITEGVTTSTIKKIIVPIFTPIKTHMKILKRDIMYAYSDITSYLHCAASTVGGSIGANISIDQRLILGIGFLPEEVEELLSPTQ